MGGGINSIGQIGIFGGCPLVFNDYRHFRQEILDRRSYCVAIPICVLAAAVLLSARLAGASTGQQPASPTATSTPSTQQQPPPKSILDRILDGLIGGVFGGAAVKVVDYFLQFRLEKAKTAIQRQQERLREKHKLADDISLQFNQFIVVLRDAHDAERRLRVSRRIPLAEHEMRELERERDERAAVLAPIQNTLWARLDAIRRVFDSEAPRETYEAFAQWYLEQMRQDTILPFRHDSEIFAWRNRILDALNAEIAGR